MLKKHYTKTGRTCRVTFKVPVDSAPTSGLAVLGDWNGWSPECNPLKARKDGSFSTTISLTAGHSYCFRYRATEGHWLDEEGADRLAPNRFGGHDCVVTV